MNTARNKILDSMHYILTITSKDILESLRNRLIISLILGMGFMLIEVSLIQMLTLLLGYPTYSLSVTLFGLLIFTGIGSLLSERLRWSRA